MNVNGNNFGPRSAMGTNNAQNLQNLQKTDKSNQVGGSQEVTGGDNSRPQGDTEVNQTIVETWGYDSDGNRQLKGVYYDHIDNGLIVAKDEYGNIEGVFQDEELHNTLKDYPNSNPY